jgi:hypothetical protein
MRCTLTKIKFNAKLFTKRRINSGAFMTRNIARTNCLLIVVFSMLTLCHFSWAAGTDDCAHEQQEQPAPHVGEIEHFDIEIDPKYLITDPFLLDVTKPGWRTPGLITHERLDGLSITFEDSCKLRVGQIIDECRENCRNIKLQIDPHPGTLKTFADVDGVITQDETGAPRWDEVTEPQIQTVAKKLADKLSNRPRVCAIFKYKYSNVTGDMKEIDLFNPILAELIESTISRARQQQKNIAINIEGLRNPLRQRYLKIEHLIKILD